jgi:hypothetical protein
MNPQNNIDIEAYIIAENQKKKDSSIPLFDFLDEIEYTVPEDDDEKKETVIVINF